MRQEPPLLTRYPNGFELLFVPNRTAPVLALDLWVRTGSAAESPEEAGMAHLVEHMLFKGTARRGPGMIAQEVEGVGGEINAFTSFDHTVYTLVLASRFAELGLDILSDAVFQSRFDPEELEREKEVVLEEIKRGNDLPHHRLSRLLFDEAFRVHPYGRPVIGREETVRAFSRDDCLTFLGRFYRPGNMTLVAVGDVPGEALREQVGQRFGRVRNRGRPARPRARREPRRGEFRCRMESREVADVYFDLAFPGPAASHRDVPALDLLATVLGQGEASRLQHRVKLDRNLVRSVGAGAYTPKDPGLIYVGGVAAPDRFGEAYEAICEELFRLRCEPVGLKELERARENVEADFVYQKETVQGQAQKAGFFHVVLGSVEAETDYLERLRRVEASEVTRVARKYLKPSRGVLALLYPRGGPAPLTPGQAAALPAEVEGRIERLRRKSWRMASPFVRRELPTGARLLVRVNPSVPVVALRAALLGGTRREPASWAGAFHVLAGCLVRGTRTRTVFDIAHQTDAISGQIDGFSGRNSFGLKAEFLSKYLEDGLDLFADLLCHSTCPPEEVEKVREDALAAIRLRKDNPGGWAFRLFEETLYGDHPFGRDVLGTPETVARLTADELRTLLARCLRPEHLAVAVAGDVDPDLVHEFFARAFESLRPTGELPAEPAPPERPRAPRVRSVDARTEQAHVIVGFLGTDIRSADRYPLRVANGILSGQGGRLFRRLRDELGLAYAVNSTCVEGLDPGYLAGYVATDPGRAERARDELLREFERLAAGELSLGDVEQARRKLVGSFEIAQQENAFQAAQMSLDEIYDLGYRAYERYAERLLSVTPADVIEACRRYVLPESCVCLMLGPGA
ncbi:MAG: pitrilysin family protein [Deferrisomatales bacterium]